MQLKMHVLLSILIIALTACKTAPIYNIDDTPFSNSRNSSLRKVSNAIVAGCKKAKWKAQIIQPGKILASYAHKNKRLSAAVMIDYDQDSYAIHYLRSRNLKYTKKLSTNQEAYDDNDFKKIFTKDTSRDRIHRAYNKWVKILENSINYEISLLNIKTITPPTVISPVQTNTKKSSCASHTPSIKMSGLAHIQGSKVNLRSGAGTHCSIVGNLSKGAQFSLSGKNGNWLFIELQDKNKAWIHSSLVTLGSPSHSSPSSVIVSTPPPPTPPSQRISIAVIQFKTLNQEAQDISLGDLISENFTSALVNSNNFKIIEREQLDKVVKEMEMTQTGFIESTDAVEIGKMLHADAIITGSVALLNNQIQLHARIIEIESAFVISAESATTRYSLSEINRTINSIVHNLSSKLLEAKKK